MGRARACAGLLGALSVGLLGALVASPLLPGSGLVDAVMAPGRAAENPSPPGSRAPRPADLVILLQRHSVNGLQEIGVFGARLDPLQPEVWSVQVWEESNDRVTIATDRIRCSRRTPLRITGGGGQLLVRQLNPGGPIHTTNRLDHLIWWAVCHPSLAGRDPASLAAEARRLGFDGLLPESQEVVPAPPVRRP